MSGKYGFAFEALIANADLAERLFQNISQSRKGSFNGAEEGKKRLASMVDTADFESEDGVVAFVGSVLDALTHDKRESPSPGVPISDQLRKGSSELDVVNSLFSLEWLVPRYSLKWTGKSLEQLSPGERGALLLIFYLLIDRRDVPLIIDQPEENLDNQTVYELLVPCIKEARKRRQVVLVTHNPNLAVVCDADQIIHCSIDKGQGNKATYLTGALENPALNRYTVDVLEGTKPAFLHRDSKYQE
jgi:predicted ATPase